MHENNATYPEKISFNSPQHLSLEALELHYRMNASILKYLELHEGKELSHSIGALFKKSLDDLPINKKLVAIKAEKKMKKSIDTNDKPKDIELNETVVMENKAVVEENKSLVDCTKEVVEEIKITAEDSGVVEENKSVVNVNEHIVEGRNVTPTKSARDEICSAEEMENIEHKETTKSSSEETLENFSKKRKLEDSGK